MNNINKDEDVYNHTFLNFCKFAESIFEDVEFNSQNLEYLKQSLPYLDSLVVTVSIFRGQEFTNPKIRPVNYDINLFSIKEEEFLKRLNRLKNILRTE